MRIKIAFNDTLPAHERRLSWQRIRRMLALDNERNASGRYAAPQGQGVYEIDEPIEYASSPAAMDTAQDTSRIQHAKRFTLDCALASGHLMNFEVLPEPPTPCAVTVCHHPASHRDRPHLDLCDAHAAATSRLSDAALDNWTRTYCQEATR